MKYVIETDASFLRIVPAGPGPVEPHGPDVLPFAREVGEVTHEAAPAQFGDGTLLREVIELAPVILDGIGKVLALLRLFGVLKK